MGKKGIIISVDFELFWGYNGTYEDLSSYNINQTLNDILSLFKKYNVKSTWAIVGRLLEENKCNSKCQTDWILSNLKDNPLVEIASHTYGHVFCKENSLDTFKDDIVQMRNILDDNLLSSKTIIFPRNQYDQRNLELLRASGYTHTRSVLSKWYLKTDKVTDESLLKRYLKRILELFPCNRDLEVTYNYGITCVSDSRFFRMFSGKLLQNLLAKYYLFVLNRELKQCLNRGQCYHIWFHPHNVICNPYGLIILERFLKKFYSLRIENKEIASYYISDI